MLYFISIEQEAHALFLHLHVLAGVFTAQNVGRNEGSSSENLLGNLGLKMTNKTHTDERKMVQLLLFGARLCYFISTVSIGVHVHVHE